MADVEEKVVDFFNALFVDIFARPFCSPVDSRLRRNGINRQVEEAADASSQSLLRLLISQRLNADEVDSILSALAEATSSLRIEDVANVHVTPELVVDRILSGGSTEKKLGSSAAITYRLALHSVVQVLLQTGAVMAEWQRLNFASTFELPRQIVNRLNQVTEQLEVLGKADQAAADQRYELIYRDYLLQRFHRVEAGTIRMTTNLDVDLRELFVMPRVVVEDADRQSDAVDGKDLLRLDTARKSFNQGSDRSASDSARVSSCLDYVLGHERVILIGPPGVGKSTFMEWLQVVVAGAEQEFVQAGKQAIPILFRIRQLDPNTLPTGRALVAKATMSEDQTALMPLHWIDRQLKDGRILFMVDGLDEVEPGLLQKMVLPWIGSLVRKYPRCRYVLSSRPVAYRPEFVRDLNFKLCHFRNFDKPQMAAYTRNWCTARRLARNEPEAEARREGEREGSEIVVSFAGYPYIRDLATNPLMLSAICLVNFFEGGRLPTDRAILYKLCVEGLLHNWDQRRGIRSDFTMQEKLRACREVALAMQAEDRAEWPLERVREQFVAALGSVDLGARLLEHVRYRSGLLLERRPNTFAFAHLTFQEYLAARAVLEGNELGISIDTLIDQRDAGRWREVIALYCGLAPPPLARSLIEALLAADETPHLGEILAESYLVASSEFANDGELRCRVLKRVGMLSHQGGDQAGLNNFPKQEAAETATSTIGFTSSQFSTSNSYQWLSANVDYIDAKILLERLWENPDLDSLGVAEILYLILGCASEVPTDRTLPPNCLSRRGPTFAEAEARYRTQAEIALLALRIRVERNAAEVLSGAFARDTLEQLVEAFTKYRRCEVSVFNKLPGPSSLRHFLDRRLRPQEVLGPVNAEGVELLAAAKRVPGSTGRDLRAMIRIYSDIPPESKD